MLPAARATLSQADVVIGYKIYLDQLAPILTPEQTKEESQLGSEIARAERAVALARSGKTVAMVSSGDIGIYAMASPIFDVLRRSEWDGKTPAVEVFPGVSAIQATAAKLGAPLGHDFCTISLSDLLTPWPVIEKRVMAAAWGDFVIGFYNPRSQKRDWQLQRAVEILLTQRDPATPVVIARNVTRPDEALSLTTLAELDVTQVDMFTLVMVGNSQSYVMHERVATPRGYVEEEKSDGEMGRWGNGEREIARALYPIALNQLAGAKVVVVGGGPVGERKIKGLLDARAKVTLISPEATEKCQSWTSEGIISWIKRDYESNDVAAAKLVFAATNSRQINAQVTREAQNMGILCNVADAPQEGDFVSPAVVRANGLVIGVNNASRNPKRAIKIRDQIKNLIDQNG
ncbi:MAG: precorrin-3B C(17)-methyltransferase [Chloroflexota bacterium]